MQKCGILTGNSFPFLGLSDHWEKASNSAVSVARNSHFTVIDKAGIATTRPKSVDNVTSHHPRTARNSKITALISVPSTH